MGASNSKSIGCPRKISLLLMHNPLISASVKFTGFPYFAPLESRSLSIIYVFSVRNN